MGRSYSEVRMKQVMVERIRGSASEPRRWPNSDGSTWGSKFAASRHHPCLHTSGSCRRSRPPFRVVSSDSDRHVSFLNPSTDWVSSAASGGTYPRGIVWLIRRTPCDSRRRRPPWPRWRRRSRLPGELPRGSPLAIRGERAAVVPPPPPLPGEMGPGSAPASASPSSPEARVQRHRTRRCRTSKPTDRRARTCTPLGSRSRPSPFRGSRSRSSVKAAWPCSGRSCTTATSAKSARTRRTTSCSATRWSRVSTAASFARTACGGSATPAR